MFLFKLKAGALQLTLFISVIIALIITGFILLVHTYNQFKIQTDFIIETVQISNKGIREALISTIPLNDTTYLDINAKDFKTLKVYREFWGVFDKVTSIGKIKNNTLKQVALIGAIQSQNNRTALHIQDNNRPLVVVGNTNIEGVAYLPKRGVKSGNISGQSYYGSQLIYGEKRLSSTLPKLSNETITQLESIENISSNIEHNQILRLENGKTFLNSFLDKKKIALSNSEIRLSNINLVGNIVIQSKTKIIVEASANLKDVILIAPEIIIKDLVKGSFQAIASKNIEVGKQSNLEYPTALILMEKEMKPINDSSIHTNHNRIFIDENSSLKGVVIFLSKPKTKNYNPQIKLEEKGTIIGEIYCTENLELNGTVYGSVFTNNFIAKQSGSVYQNHIYNGIITINKLPQEYVGLTFNDSKIGVLKWLY
ncbi:hypothetical protein [Olleya sp.]|jgi:cytoskeletal protein CcmA (bactofilin family)|uniref:hypothetical protein n=1 Tax=Olleya sp. TaxID=1906788 RepID=UPI0032D92B38